MLHYAEKQVEINKTLERALQLSNQGKERYLKTIPFTILIENLSFSSTVFRHSLRLTITILIGFIGKALPFQNAYWMC
jgi:uncharacterized membrane protein YccC